MEKEYYVFYNENSHAYIKQMDRRLVSGDIDYSETEDIDKAFPVLVDANQAKEIAKKVATELNISEKLIVVKKASEKSVTHIKEEKLLSDLHEAIINCLMQGGLTKRTTNVVINDFSNYAGIELEQSDDWD
ncbi:hypothetical protein HMPREF9103_00819 [Lentilactobacillus parafarraginis F0439]|uniref:Uncharacterized protein n=1 Tax=Lentilactobacillus parafarraginis F0439 TaxID=797515 RepID=G9ZM71_9LACO|nr:hypothetical protein [Lentilactobacillus parafarraginis]EHL99836.1 hypothetical protein HMPREF9103_00819 [Lentilactobacillus parafarraginis F0439]